MSTAADIRACKLRNEFLEHKAARAERERDSLAQVRQAMRFMLEDLEKTRISLEENTEARKHLDKELFQARKMDAVGTLVGGIAHNLNNILAGITGGLYLTRRKVQEIPDAVAQINRAEKLAFRAAEIIQKLLTFARRGRVNMDEFSFSPFIKESLEMLRASLPEDIAWHQEICTDALRIRGDATLLHQVLANLVSNARDAVAGVDQPCITVRLESFHADAAWLKTYEYFKPGRYAHLSVEDNGCGISEDRMDRLFEPFFTTKEVGKGDGLGLAMVFGAVKTHHGFMAVESVGEGKGSVFHFYLPLLMEPHKAVAEAPRAEDTDRQGSGELILVADDRDYVRETTAEVLELMGYRVLRAVDGLEALEIFKAHRQEIALTLLDVTMPKLGGARLAGLIRKIKPDVPVIIMTGYDKEYVFGSSEPIKNSEIITKPVQFDALNRAIRQLLG